MTEQVKVVQSKSVGYLGLLSLLFIGLKLGGVISWSWWLVLLPIYGPVVLALALFALVAAFVGGVNLATDVRRKRR